MTAMKLWQQWALLLALLCVAAIGVGASPPAPIWGQAAGNSEHTRQAFVNGPTVPHVVAVGIPPNVSLLFDPILVGAGGLATLYSVCNDGGTVCAFSAINSTLQWMTSWDGGEVDIAVDSGVLLATHGSMLSAYDLASGEALWDCDLTPLPVMTVSNGVVYVGTSSIVAVSASTGRVLWNVTGLLDVTWQVGVTCNNIVFATSGNGTVYAIGSGRVLWSAAVGAATDSSGMCSPDGVSVMYVSNQCVMVALDVATGAPSWQYATSVDCLGYGAVTAASASSVFYAYSENLWALQPSNGSLQWSLSFQQDVVGLAVDVQGVLFVAFSSCQPAASAFTPAGNLIWSVDYDSQTSWPTGIVIADADTLAIPFEDALETQSPLIVYVQPGSATPSASPSPSMSPSMSPSASPSSCPPGTYDPTRGCAYSSLACEGCSFLASKVAEKLLGVLEKAAAGDECGLELFEVMGESCLEVAAASEGVGGLVCAALAMGIIHECNNLEAYLDQFAGWFCATTLGCSSDGNDTPVMLAPQPPRVRAPLSGYYDPVWPNASFDAVAYINTSTALPGVNTSATHLQKTHVDFALQAWAEDTFNGTALLSTVQHCAPSPNDPSVVVGTLYRRFPNGSCVTTPNAPCSVLQAGYFQSSFANIVGFNDGVLAPVHSPDSSLTCWGQWDDYLMQQLNSTVTLCQDANTLYPKLLFVTSAPLSNASTTLLNISTVTYASFAPRPASGGDPTPFHPSWLSTCA